MVVLIVTPWIYSIIFVIGVYPGFIWNGDAMATWGDIFDSSGFQGQMDQSVGLIPKYYKDKPNDE